MSAAVAVTLPRKIMMSVNQSTVYRPGTKICCPRCEARFDPHLQVEVVERVVPQRPRTVEEVLKRFDLRPKELQAAMNLAEGLRIREIAVIMKTTEGTVKQYMRYVYLKTQTRSRQEFRMMVDALRYQA